MNFLWKGQPDRNVIVQVIEENLTILYVHQSGIFQKSSGNLRQLVFIKALTDNARFCSKTNVVENRLDFNFNDLS